MNVYKIDFSKDRFKFSAAHFTLFSATTAESLHGHNYQGFVSVSFLQLDHKTGMAAPFHDLKKEIEKVFQSLDEKTLLPEKSPFLKIHKKEKNIEVHFHKKFYSFPKADVTLLPMVNITSELLASYIHQKLSQLWIKKYSLYALEIGIQETSGQKVFYGGLFP